MSPELDITQAQVFTRQLFNLFTGGILGLMIHIGYKTGLFEVLAKGEGTSEQIAARARLNERYVRKWLAAMTTGRIVVFDRASRTYSLPAAHAICLSGGGRLNVAPVSGLIPHLSTHVPKVIDAFRDGGGVPYEEYRPEFTDLMDDLWRRIYDDSLLDGFLASIPGLPERLKGGARVADIGCGTGHAINLMAREFPRSIFVGYDLAEDAIDKARAEAQAMHLSNAHFEVLDVAQLPAEPRFDVIFAFDSIHDQVDPATVLRKVNEALGADGVYLMVDFKGTSDVHEDMSNPFAPFYYGVSTMHCMTVSLAHDGAGLGTMWGEKVARRTLQEAGFTKVEVVDSPRPQNVIYICKK